MALNEQLKESYVSQLLSLLPNGFLWDKISDTNLKKMLIALATELVNSHIRLEKLTLEAVPTTTDELLEEWEKLLGLPDACSLLKFNGESTLNERKALILARIANKKPCTKAFLESFIESLGYKAEVSVLKPFVLGLSRAGDALNGANENRFFILVKLLEQKVEYFRFGKSEMGKDPMGRIDYAKDLECYLKKYTPAYTRVCIGYK